MQMHTCAHTHTNAYTHLLKKKQNCLTEQSMFTWTDDHLDYRGVLSCSVMTAVESLQQLQSLQIF